MLKKATKAIFLKKTHSLETLKLQRNVGYGERSMKEDVPSFAVLKKESLPFFSSFTNYKLLLVKK